MNQTHVFNTYQDFTARRNKSVNGVHVGYASENPGYRADNATNTGCWECKGCTDCVECTRCRDCHDCRRSQNCIECKSIVGSSDCRACFDSDLILYCTNCFNCTRCFGCKGCGHLIEANNDKNVLNRTTIAK